MLFFLSFEILKFSNRKPLNIKNANSEEHMDWIITILQSIFKLKNIKKMTIIWCRCVLGRDRGIYNVAKPDKKFCFEGQLTSAQQTVTEVGVSFKMIFFMPRCVLISKERTLPYIVYTIYSYKSNWKKECSKVSKISNPLKAMKPYYQKHRHIKTWHDFIIADPRGSISPKHWMYKSQMQ